VKEGETRGATGEIEKIPSTDGIEAIKAGCERFLSRHRAKKTAREWLEELAASPAAEPPPDFYGEGEAIASLEREVACLLGKETGTFVIKGVIAQQCALRVHCDRAGAPAVALHPKSHVDLDEDGAYERLHGLRGVRLGSDDAPFTFRDLGAVREPLGAVVVELPLRRAGFKLLPWEELVAISEWCRQKGVPLHLDGARLWESQPFYGRPYSEIAALADSVYVSFYKGLGGLAGCVLAGEEAFVEEAKAWKTRHGGNVHTSFPYVISAKEGLKRHLPKMAAYRDRARDLAEALCTLPGVRVAPAPPHANTFRLYLQGEREPLERAALDLATDELVWLFDTVESAAVPGYSFAEVQIGEAAEDLSDEEVVGLVDTVLKNARLADRSGPRSDVRS